MFGVDFQVSDGQCTRGINLALVPSKRNVGYDFVLLLDTDTEKTIEPMILAFDLRKLFLMNSFRAEGFCINKKHEQF